MAADSAGNDEIQFLTIPNWLYDEQNANITPIDVNIVRAADITLPECSFEAPSKNVSLNDVSRIHFFFALFVSIFFFDDSLFLSIGSQHKLRFISR